MDTKIKGVVDTMEYIIKNLDHFINQHKPNTILLVQPNYPIAHKTRYNKEYYPLALLKIASYLKTKNIKSDIVICGAGDYHLKKEYDMIFITSLFTYHSKSVKKAVQCFKHKYLNTPIILGGVYATLLPEHAKKYTGAHYIYTGIIPEAEISIDQSLELYKHVDFQILHTSRGCIRQCNFCGSHKIEPNFIYKKTIKKEINKEKILFYDNNLLANPYIKDILLELKELKKQKKIKYVENQSGFDGRLLTPEIAQLLKEAGFKNPKIAWDHHYKDYPKIKKQLDMLTNAGFKPKTIGVFMVYNYNIPYEEMEKKRAYVHNYGSLIIDCRYRPLTQTYDNYNSWKKQTDKDYYIHPLWTDKKIKQFRKNVRQSNVCITFDKKYFCKELMTHNLPKDEINKYNTYTYNELINEGLTVFDPTKPHHIKEGITYD